MFSLKTMIAALTGDNAAPLEMNIQGAVIDSRKAFTDSVFIALPGETADGHDYVQAAFNNGALLALVHKDMPDPLNTADLRPGHYDPTQWATSKFPLCLRVNDTLNALQTLATYIRKQRDIRVIGITGSVGKTTTKELTASLLSEKYHVLKNPGNRNNEIGLPLTLLELEPHHDCAVLEMGFYVPGEIQTLCEIAQPQVGVITNIGTVHAERAGSQETIAKGKAELVEYLSPAPDGIAIINQDDTWARWMKNRTQAQLLTYGIDQPADLMASQISLHGMDGISCTLAFQGETHKIYSPLLGEFSVYTILRAAAAALAEGLSWDQITERLHTTQVDLRMRTFKLPSETTIIDDTYNASPESTIAALHFLKTLEGRRVAILGDMLELGAYEYEGHQAVGAFCADAVDMLILVGERSKITAEAAIQNGFPTDHLQWYPDSQQAAKPAAESLKEGDVVLIKGSNSMHMDKILTQIEAKE